MRRVLKSMWRLGWSMSMFGLDTLTKAVRRPEDAARGLDAVQRAASQHIDGPCEGLASTAQGPGSEAGVPDAPPRPDHGPSASPVATSQLHSMVVLGEGLAAGMGHFALSLNDQKHSFAAQVASQLGISFEQPGVQAPGLGAAPGLEPQPVIVPEIYQSTTRVDDPQATSSDGPDNLSVPGMTLDGSLNWRPKAPLIRRDDPAQTAVNCLLGWPGIRYNSSAGPSQAELARRRPRDLGVVALGFQEAIDLALGGSDAGGDADQRSSDPASWGRQLNQLLRQIAAPRKVVCTVPDPLDTAYFSDLETAAEILKTDANFLARHLRLQADDRLTLPGLYAVGCQLMERRLEPLDRSHVLDAGTAQGLSARVRQMNVAVATAASDTGSVVCDFHALLQRLARQPIQLAGKTLQARYLGGFYLLNGLYPGATGQAALANEVLRTVHQAWGVDCCPIDLQQVANDDPNTLTQLAPGGRFTDEFLRPRPGDALMPWPPLAPGLAETPIQTVYPHLEPGKQGCTPKVGVPAGGFDHPELETPLQLPEGLEQTLDLQSLGSTLTDALRVVDCPDDRPIIPGFPPFGLCGELFFGGPAVTTSHLRGKVHIKFSPPDAQQISRFEVRHPGGLVGRPGELAAPWLFRMPAELTRLDDLPELVSHGELNLRTGEVLNLHYNLRNINTALRTLMRVNPKHPLPHLALLYPGAPNGGSSWARFTQRDDGQLDFTFAGNLFVPLGVEAGGDPIRFALPFTTPDLDAASFLSRGTSLHPQLCLTTRSEPISELPSTASAAPEVPQRCVRELIPFVHNTSFGDAFDLDIPQLGGPATGRSHLMGRLRLQFGAATDGTVPVLVQVLPPGGLMSDAPRPLPMLPPGVARGMIGFDEVMRFPSGVDYPQSGLANADDPFNLALGNIDLRTGRLTSPLLLRGFVIQALFGHLVAVEPCTPASSFNYSGPARLEVGASGNLVFRYDGSVYIPYPEGFKFPSPSADGLPAFTVEGPSRLDPFRRIQAMESVAVSDDLRRSPLRGEAQNMVSSIGQRFSYRYVLTTDGSAAAFEYVNHSQGARFTLKSLSWLSLTHSRHSRGEQPDALTFGGFGTWTGAGAVGEAADGGGSHQVSVHISQAPEAPYVGILVDGGVISNVNTKPLDIATTLP